MAALRRGSGYAEDVERGKSLVEAARNGNLIELTTLLDSGVSVNAEEYNKSLFYASKNYVTPLQVAAANGHTECVTVLIERGADLGSRDRFDVTAVHMAAEKGHLKCIKALLAAGAECCVATKYSKKGCYTAHPHPGGTTALHLAASNNHVDCVRELIQYGADYNAVDEKGRTSLYVAAEAGLEECLLAHLKSVVGRNILSLPSHESGDTPLHFCVVHGMARCVSELLKHGSDVNHRNWTGFSPLVYTVLYNPDTEAVVPKILKLLVTKGYKCDINKCDYTGLSPLHYVSFSDGIRFLRRPKMAAFLIAYGADTNITNQRGYSLIQAEMKLNSNDLTILRALVKSMLHLPPLHSLNLVPPPPSPPPWPPWAYQMPIYGDAHHHVPGGPPPGVDLIFMANEDNLEPAIPGGADPAHPQRRMPKNKAPFRSKYQWYKEISSNPRSLQHYCRFVIRKTMGHKRLRDVKELPIPVSLQQYLLLGYDEYK